MTVPFETTLQLLDAADRLTAPAPIATPEELATHLQAVSASLGKPLDVDQARAAVATLQTSPTRVKASAQALARVLPYEISWDRPATPAHLERAQTRAQATQHRVQRAHRRFMRGYRHRQGLTLLTWVLTFGAGGTLAAALLTLGLGGPLPLMIVGTFAGLFGGAVVGAILNIEHRMSPWWDRRRSAHLERLQRADLALTELQPSCSPVTLDQVKAWMAVPGLSRHLYALAADPMSFLQGDVRRLDRGLKRQAAQIQADLDAKARAEREQAEQAIAQRRVQEAAEQAQREREAILSFLAPQEA